MSSQWSTETEDTFPFQYSVNQWTGSPHFKTRTTIPLKASVVHFVMDLWLHFGTPGSPVQDLGLAAPSVSLQGSDKDKEVEPWLSSIHKRNTDTKPENRVSQSPFIQHSAGRDVKINNIEKLHVFKLLHSTDLTGLLQCCNKDASRNQCNTWQNFIMPQSFFVMRGPWERWTLCKTSCINGMSPSLPPTPIYASTAPLLLFFSVTCRNAKESKSKASYSAQPRYSTS